MTTKDIIKQMDKGFDEKFKSKEGKETAYMNGWLLLPDDTKAFIHSYTRTLLESFGEEIMSASIGAIPTSDDYAKGWNDSRQENYKVKSLKVKEIISSIGK